MQNVHDVGPALEQLDLNGLVVLDALLATRSVTTASRRLGLSQSATSHALARLRTTFDDALLVRGAGGLVLTARAEAIELPLREAIAALRGIVERPRSFDPATARRHFTLATTDYVGLLMLPTLTRELASDAPGVDVWLANMDPSFIDQLARGDLDVAIAPRRADYDRPGVRAQVLFDERFVCLVRRGHPVVGKRWTAERFAGLDHVLIAPIGRPGGVVDDVLAQLGLRRRVALLLPSFLTSPFVIAESDLVLTLPERVARRFASQLPLEVLEPPLVVPGFTLALLWHDRNHRDPAHVWLRARLVAIAQGIRGAGVTSKDSRRQRSLRRSTAR